MAQIIARPTTKKGKSMFYCQHCTFNCETIESAVNHEEETDHYTMWWLS